VFLLVSNALTVTINFSGYFIDLRDGRINLGTFGVVLLYRFAGVSGSSMMFSCSESDSSSASHLSLLKFWFAKSSSQLSQFAVSEMLSGALF
jgi:hypothetical protein